MAVIRYYCRSIEAGGGVGAIGGLVIHRATQPRAVQPTYLAFADSCMPSCDNMLASLARQKNHKRLVQRSRLSFQLQTTTTAVTYKLPTVP